MADIMKMRSFGVYLDKKHLRKTNLNNIAPTIINIITDFAGEKTHTEQKSGLRKFISW